VQQQKEQDAIQPEKKRASEEQPQEIDIKAEMKRHAPEQFPIIQVAACWYAEKCMYHININIEI